jgi:tyrosinase
MFAIWQAIHGPNSPEPYVVPTPARKGNFTTAAKQQEDDKTPLEPFSNTKGDFWKAKDVKETKTFGYCYPETEEWKFSGKPGAYRKDTIDKIRVLYPAGSLANIIRDKAKDSKASIKLLESRAETVAQTPLQQLKVERQVEDLAPDNKYLEWITNLKAKKHTLGASFNVHVFLGPITEENPVLWHTEENHVGAFAVLGQPADTGCEKCQSDQTNDVQVTAQIPLTVALAERYLANKIDGLTPEVVRPYLQENLHWRVTRVSLGSTFPHSHGH